MESLWLIHGDNESDGRGGTVAVVSLRNKKLEFMSGCVAYAAMRDGIEAGVLFFFSPAICGGQPEVGLTGRCQSLLDGIQPHAHTHVITIAILFHSISCCNINWPNQLVS